MREFVINIIILVLWLIFHISFLFFMPIWAVVDSMGCLLTSKNKVGWFVKEIWNSRKILRFR